jgi:hypothetical protein
MTHMLIVTAVVILVYGAAAAAVLAVYRAADDAAAARATQTIRQMRQPRAEQQPRRPAGDQLALAEAAVTRRVVAGRLDPATYQRTMAAIAARDAVAHPLTAPEPPR